MRREGCGEDGADVLLTINQPLCHNTVDVLWSGMQKLRAGSVIRANDRPGPSAVYKGIGALSRKHTYEALGHRKPIL
jgi:hypothetical protein